MADHPDRLAGLEERADEFHRLRFGPELIRVRHAAGQDQPVEFGRVGVPDGLVDFEGVAFFEVVEGLDLAPIGGKQCDLRAGFADRGDRYRYAFPA